MKHGTAFNRSAGYTMREEDIREKVLNTTDALRGTGAIINGFRKDNAFPRQKQGLEPAVFADSIHASKSWIQNSNGDSAAWDCNSSPEGRNSERHNHG